MNVVAANTTNHPRQSNLVAKLYRVELVRFLIVGAVNTLVSYAIYSGILFAGFNYSFANLVALISGILFSFKTQGLLVFYNSDVRRFWRFVLSWSCIYFVTITVIGSIVSAGINPYLAGLLALPLSMVLSYISQKFFVFRRSQVSAESGAPINSGINLNESENMLQSLRPSFPICTSCLSENIFRFALLMLLYIVVSAWCLDTYMRNYGFNEYDNIRWGLQRSLDFTGWQPVVHRALMPLIVNGATNILPDDAVKLISDHSGMWKYLKAPKAGLWTPEFATKYTLMYFLCFSGLLWCLLVLRSLTKALVADIPVLCDFAPLGFVVLLPLSFVEGGFQYDFFELPFLASAYLLAFYRKYFWLAAMIPLSILNKETALLVPLLVFPITYKNEGWAKSLKLSLFLLGLGIITYICIIFTFRESPAVAVENPWLKHLVFLLKPTTYFRFFAPYASMIPLPRGLNLLWLAFLAFNIWFGWEYKKRVVRQMFGIATALNIPLFILFVSSDEVRDLSLIFVPLYLLSCGSLVLLYRRNNSRAIA